MRILIVEDEALTAMVMHSVLADQGYEVVDIADDEATAIGAAALTTPDLAFVDIQLAGGDSGISVARRLKAMGIPVLFSTGNCPGKDAAELAIGCIHKPVMDDQLAAGAAVARAILSRQTPPPLPKGMHLFRSESGDAHAAHR